jgi:hypothetical protein
MLAKTAAEDVCAEILKTRTIPQLLENTKSSDQSTKISAIQILLELAKQSKVKCFHVPSTFADVVEAAFRAELINAGVVSRILECFTVSNNQHTPPELAIYGDEVEEEALLELALYGKNILCLSVI